MNVFHALQANPDTAGHEDTSGPISCNHMRKPSRRADDQCEEGQRSHEHRVDDEDRNCV